MDPFTPSSSNPDVPAPKNLDRPTLMPTGSPSEDDVDANLAAPSAGGDPDDAADSSGAHERPSTGPAPSGDWPTDPTV